MTIRHHPDETFLTRLAGGRLEPGPALVVRAHLDRCADCRRNVESLEAAAGALLDALPPTPMDDEALARALARIETPAPESAKPPTRKKRRIGFGIWYLPLEWNGHGARAYELHVPAGMQIPVHTHSGEELTCILQGSFSDETGSYEAGDFIATDAAVLHSPHAGHGAECICIIASEAPLKMKSLLARAMQAYLRL